MINDRLRTTLHAAGLTEGELAEQLGVDPKTVQRWITQGRTPHRTTATRVAKLLDVPLTWLWQDLDAIEKGEATGEVVNLYAHRSQVPRQLWLDLVLHARKRIDFL